MIQTKLKWKKSLFTNLYILYVHDKEIGRLKEKSFSQIANGELYGRTYTFKTKGYFNQYTEIEDGVENKIVGKITYNKWMTKATIKINNKESIWENHNFWNSKWSLSSTEGTDIKYSGASTDGEIDSNTDDPMLLLSGLFISNYYWQISIAVSVIIFIAIMPTIFG